MDGKMAIVTVNKTGVAVHDCYDIKDELKKSGYKFSSADKSWSKPHNQADPQKALEVIAKDLQHALTLGCKLRRGERSYNEMISYVLGIIDPAKKTAWDEAGQNYNQRPDWII